MFHIPLKCEREYLSKDMVAGVAQVLHCEGEIERVLNRGGALIGGRCRRCTEQIDVNEYRRRVASMSRQDTMAWLLKRLPESAGEELLPGLSGATSAAWMVEGRVITVDVNVAPAVNWALHTPGSVDVVRLVRPLDEPLSPQVLEWFGDFRCRLGA